MKCSIFPIENWQNPVLRRLGVVLAAGTIGAFYLSAMLVDSVWRVAREVVRELVGLVGYEVDEYLARAKTFGSVVKHAWKGKQ